MLFAEFATDRGRGLVVAFLVWSAVLVPPFCPVTDAAAVPAARRRHESYGWRIPFLIAAPLGLVGLYIRMRLTDTPAFEALLGVRRGGRILAAGGHHHRAGRVILQVIGVMIIHNVGFYVAVHLPANVFHQDAALLQGSVVPVHHGGQRGGAGADPSAGRPFGTDRAAPPADRGAAGFAVLAFTRHSCC